MASTNHTTNYNLSQYVATDKPTYLVDYNNDMLAIDTQMKVNATAAATAQTAAETADAKAVTADGKAVTAQSSAASAQTSADSANNKIGIVANLETADKTSIVAAINEVIGYFNLEATDNITMNNVTVTGGVIASFNQGVYKTAINNNGTLAKLYGYMTYTKSSDRMKVTFNTSLRPATNITLNDIASYQHVGSTERTGYADAVIKTNGDVEVELYDSYTGNGNLYLLPFLLFIKDFGDVITPTNGNL